MLLENGNRRSTILFIYKYLQKNGIKLNKDIFKDNSEYVRNAFVASTFEDVEISIHAN